MKQGGYLLQHCIFEAQSTYCQQSHPLWLRARTWPERPLGHICSSWGIRAITLVVGGAGRLRLAAHTKTLQPVTAPDCSPYWLLACYN
ncbi:hypothetical protein CEXT_618181 [Caerostris extrusa]|uniref:Uncharacterized protein n=1 Tax=Caerostris extrusa TaxID=172846 RepID=A0AAV4MJM9_CAEEX|nr:hypothetical protein CEXT_618181 [Caerostris extrusa]